MIKIKSFILALSLTPLLLSVWQLPNQAQLSPNSPSKGTAGSLSGNNSGAGGVTIFSLPPANVSAALQALVNAYAQNAVVSLQGGSFRQQQLVALVASVIYPIVNSAQDRVPGDVLVEIVQTSGGQQQTFTTLAATLQALIASIDSPSANGSVILKIHGKKIVISNKRK